MIWWMQQFRHGATMHGPKPRSHAIKLQKKVRRLGLKIALSARAAEGKVNARLYFLSPHIDKCIKMEYAFHYLVA